MSGRDDGRVGRRRFLCGAGASLATAGAWPLRAVSQRAGAGAASAAGTADVIRVRGRIRASGAGVANVSVTDGQSIVRTARDGSFTLVADAHQPFVYVSLPDGFEIPQNASGTARFYQPLAANAAGEMDAVFDLTPRRATAERHTCLVVSDTQTQDLEDMGQLHAQTVPDLQALLRAHDGTPVFGLALGDIMYDHLELYPEYERAVRDIGVPFFQVVGNHDLDVEGRSAEQTVATFMRHFGPPYYSFDLGAMHYVVLQDVFWHGTGYVGYVDERQLRWLERDLSFVERGRPVVVFTHIPLVGQRFRRQGRASPDPGTSVNNRAALYELLAPYRAHVVSGHTHENEHVFEGGVHEHIHGTACGGWWTGPICYDGTPSGYGIYEARGEELRWTYKATGQPLDHQLRLYGPGADPQAPDELVANVWNWDPQWRVEWVADGVPRGPMARRVGLDPLSVELHGGTSKPTKRPWVDPQPTNHLFYAPVATGVREVAVHATDRTGRPFSARWQRTG